MDLSQYGELVLDPADLNALEPGVPLMVTLAHFESSRSATLRLEPETSRIGPLPRATIRSRLLRSSPAQRQAFRHLLGCRIQPRRGPRSDPLTGIGFAIPRSREFSSFGGKRVQDLQLGQVPLGTLLDLVLRFFEQVVQVLRTLGLLAQGLIKSIPPDFAPPLILACARSQRPSSNLGFPFHPTEPWAHA